jgi:hypothetical protein
MTRDYLADLNEQQRHAVKHGVSQVPRQRFPGDDLVEHPANRRATEVSALLRNVSNQCQWVNC